MSNQRIWKFPFPLQDKFNLSLPKGAQLLDIQMQDGTPTLWALVDADEPLCEKRNFVIYGTGHPAAVGARDTYLKTLQIGGLVLHVFEIQP